MEVWEYKGGTMSGLWMMNVQKIKQVALFLVSIVFRLEPVSIEASKHIKNKIFSTV